MDVTSEVERRRPFSVKVGRSEDFPTPGDEHGCPMNSGASGTMIYMIYMNRANAVFR